MQRNPLVSIIAINYNSTDDTIDFLKSVEKISYPNYECILVDNASRIDPGPILQPMFPWVKYIRSEENLGFAGGNNLGIRASRGELIVLLNNDTLLPEGFLEPIVQFSLAHPEAGFMSPKILNTDRKTLQYVGSIGVSPFTGRGKRLASNEPDLGQYDRIYETDLAHGAALLVPRSVVEKVGPMPEVFFLYYEEHDWCEQVKRAGYKIYYVGTTHIIHKGSVSVGGSDSPLKIYYMTRNRLLFMKRNFKGIPLLSGLLFFSLFVIPKNTIVYLAKRRFDLLSAFYRGFWWNLKKRTSFV